jgi:adenylate cyclase
MRRLSRQRRRTAALLAVGVIAGATGVLAYATHLLRHTEQQSIDARFSVRGSRPAPADLLLVQIDNKTLQTLRNRRMASEFPFPRRYDAQVIDRLRQAGAKVIALDIEFSHETDTADDDALIESIGRARGKVVLATTEVGPRGQNPVLGGEGLPERLSARVGEALLLLDSDGVARRLAYSFSGLHSFAVATAEAATGHRVSVSSFESGGALPIDFAGPPGTIRSVSYSDVLLGRVPPALVRGKIVIVGASAPVLQDYHATATTGSAVMSGPEIQANETETILQGGPLRDAPTAVDILLILLLALGAPLSALQVRTVRSLIGVVALAALFLLAVQVAFQAGLIVSLVYPMLALAVGTLGSLMVLYLFETIERERVRSVFSRFVPAEVVDQVLARADENLRLAGEERDATVMFCDLRGFTSFSEAQPAARVIEVVNCYLNEMTEAILDAGGTLVAYMGDGIMAVFGAPLEQDDHADRALRAAREMVGPRLARFNAWLGEQGFERRFEMGIGLNSGPVMSGNVGSEQRVEYTALGNTTNTAARLEALTKDSSVMLFIAESARERLRRPPTDLELVGDLEVRGRSQPLTVWTLAEAGSVEKKSGSEFQPVA